MPAILKGYFDHVAFRALRLNSRRTEGSSSRRCGTSRGWASSPPAARRGITTSLVRVRQEGAAARPEGHLRRPRRQAPLSRAALGLRHFARGAGKVRAEGRAAVRAVLARASPDGIRAAEATYVHAAPASPDHALEAGNRAAPATFAHFHHLVGDAGLDEREARAARGPSGAISKRTVLSGACWPGTSMVTPPAAPARPCSPKPQNPTI